MSVSTSNTANAKAQAIRSHLCDKQTQKNKRGTGQLIFAGELQKKKSAETARFNNIFWKFVTNLILNKYDIHKN